MLDASSALARAVRRIVAVVCALGIVVVLLGVLDGERGVASTRAWSVVVHTYPAGGTSITTWVFVMMIAGVRTVGHPTRRNGWFFAIFALLTAMPAMVWWSVDHYDLLLAHEVLWPQRAMLPLIGAMVLLACVALPIALLTRSDRIDDGPPTARVVR
jgi:hypothetical protein